MLLHGVMIMNEFMCVATPIRDEAYCLERYLDNVAPMFDGVVALLDNRTTDNSKDILVDRGATVEEVSFVDFAQMGNDLLNLCRSLGYVYAFILNPDEMITEDSSNSVIDYLNDDPSCDMIHIARHNWYDLEMVEERKDVFPDYQCKVIKLDNKGIHYRGRVHEVVVGANKVAVLPHNVCTHHFNLYYYKTGDQDYEKKIEQYNKLSR